MMIVVSDQFLTALTRSMPPSFKADLKLLGVYFRNHISVVRDDLAFSNWFVLIANALPFLLWMIDFVRLVMV